MKIQAEIVKESYVKDTKGNTLGKEFNTVIGTILLSSLILPFGTNQTRQSYGFEIETTHRTFTNESIESNTYIKYDGVVYHVLEVTKYPVRSVLLLKKVK